MSRFAYFVGGVGPNVKSVAVVSFVALALSSCSPDLVGQRVGDVTYEQPDQVEPQEAPVRSPQAAEMSPSAELLVHMGAADRSIALTFDDGPHPEYTPQVLELLAKYDAVATFCFVGSEAERHPELVRAVVDAGMYLCNHTSTHDYDLVNWSDAKIEKELLGARDVLRSAAGSDIPVPYFRAPGGFWSDRLREIAARNGMKPLSWSVDTRDWAQPGAPEIIASVKKNAGPGAVVLMHDGGGPREQTVAALARLLPWYVEQGYRFVLPTEDQTPPPQAGRPDDPSGSL